MPFWPSFKRRGCLPLTDPWTARLRTARAIGLLCMAMLLVALVPFRLWRSTLGSTQAPGERDDPATVRLLSAHIQRAASRLPFTVKCLPQAMALSWQLRRRGLRHRIIFAVRPPGERGDSDSLHAWIECGEAVVLGDLPGPWLQVHAQPC